MGNKCKNILVISSILFLLFFAGQAFGQEKNWDAVATEVNSEQSQTLEDVEEMKRLVAMDEAALKKELANLKADEKKAETTLTQLENEFARLRKLEEQHKQDLENERDEIEAIEGNFRGTAREAITVSRDNPITAEYPERGDEMTSLAESKRFPGLDGIKSLVEFFFTEMNAEGKILKRTGTFIGPDGKETTGEILRIGKFVTYYRMSDGKVGFLKPEANGKRLIAVTGDIPRGMLSGIESYFAGNSEVVPVDLSGGGFFSHLTTSENFRDWIDKGGIIMYAILAVGVFAILLGLERIIVLGTKAKASDKVMNQIKEFAASRKWHEAKAYCSSKSRIPTCQMLDSVIEHVGHKQEVLENALQEAILKQVPKLERFIPTLALLAVISPLLGLLGTVTGMITTFKIITEVGTGDPGMLAGGISEALLTTQFGLMVAIPVMVLHHFLKSQVDKIVVDMQEKGTAFAVTLAKQEGEMEE